ncbi:MAG: type II toxin-antitoxin system VapC family toxin [Spirochaetales bacterium]|jgi:predicted nucleic acid-binding protein|nr:type II toxin-antitoxin system VapC family toxin [Spirochaetales bacterium]
MPVTGECIYVLDACALIAFLDKEPGGSVVAELFQKAEAGEICIYITSIQLLEVYYDRIRVIGRDYADTFLQTFYGSSIKIVHEFSRENIRTAGRLKATYPLSLADAIACAVASSIDAALVTSDHKEFEPVEQHENINFFWIRPAQSKTPKKGEK